MNDANMRLDGDQKPLSKDDVLSFKARGRPVRLEMLADEFYLMQGFLKNAMTPEVARRICTKSGSHLIKLVSPRVDGEHAILRFHDKNSNRKSSFLPSVNAPDIPFCKVVFRPLEIIGFPTMSVVDHILNPAQHSHDVLSAFAQIFGEDTLDAMRDALLVNNNVPQKLGSGEFPIIFIPRHDGGDLQTTPVSPALAFMGMKQVTSHYFQKKQPDAPPPPRGRWSKQAVSSKPQNISGAIGGPRVRFLATMPHAMHQFEAEIFRYIQGGRFPRWQDDNIITWVPRYGDMLEANAEYNNKDTRAALDRIADRFIHDAHDFIKETLEEVIDLAALHGLSQDKISLPPTISELLIRRRWGNERSYNVARKALSSPHFKSRLSKITTQTQLLQEPVT